MPNRSNNNLSRQRKKQKLDNNSNNNSNTLSLRTRNVNNSSDHYITTDEEVEESDSGELENIVKPIRSNKHSNSHNRLRNNATSRTKFQSNNSNRINNNLKRRNSLPRKQSPTQSTSNLNNSTRKRLQSNNNSTASNTNTLNTRRSSFTKVSNPLSPSQKEEPTVSSPARPLRKSLHVQFSDNNLMAPLNGGGKRLREPSGGTPIARKSTRSATMIVLPDHDRGKKRKREIIALQDEELLESDEEVEEEDIEDYEEEEEGTEEMEEGRRLRSADTKVDDEEEDDEELEEDPEEEEEVEEEDLEENDDVDVELETEGDHFNLFTANTTQLKRLKRAELVRLYALATSEPLSEVDALHKPSLVEGIIANRPITTDEEPSGSEEEEEEAVDEEEEEEAVASGEELEEGDDVDSPRPGTSHETSPVTSTSTRRRGNNTASARAGRKGKTVGSNKIKRKSKLRNLVDLNQDLPEDEEEKEEVQGEEEEEEELGENDTVRDHASSSDEVTKPSVRFNKRGSQSLPGLTSIPPPRRQLRNRSTGSAGSNSSLIFGMEASPVPTGMRRLRNGKKVGTILGGGKGAHFHNLGALGEASGSGESEEEEEEEEEEVDTEEEEEQEIDGMSPPVATRTRHGAPSAPNKPSTSSPKARPGRIAKSKAVAKIVRTTTSKKGKERAINQDMIQDDDDEEEMEVDGDEEEEEEEEEVTTTRNRNGSKIATTRSGLRRGSHNSQPSDADDEEEEPEEELDPDDEEDQDGDDDGEGDMSVEMVSHQRAAATHLRNGKVVVLVPDEELEEDEGSENGMEVEAEEEEEEEAGEEDEMVDEDEGDLANATSKSLLRRRRDDLVRLCEERSIVGEGTKKELVHALLEWRNHEGSSGESSSHSTLSAGSNATARGETKTQALRAIPSITTINGRTPLLMRPGHSYSASPEKPHTLPQSKADEQEEVNALDLESLQLQDKEIAPDKLTRLEQVGSGGFKDVFKGLYRKKSVAISDIRGHLTEMDIKELGLLRDLRHPNIVHFIGVSIPKEPSSVPVMIVTELCANGDLFDYIRAVPCPAFSVMLDIMLGISKGVDYLHTRKPTIIHRDIKASNVLITAAGTAKINDFGLARVKTNARSMIRSLVGTVNYQAPELWTPNPRYNEKVDVYSVALVFWEVCQWNQAKKRYPFEGMNEHAIYSEAGQKKIRPSLIAARRVYGQGIADLIEAMWQADFHDRPPMSQVVLELQVLLTAEKDKEKDARGR